MKPDFSLIPQGATVAVACSGGRDSMVLLDALLGAGLRVRILHVNHALRPTADRDEAFVRAQAALHGLEIRVFRARKNQFEGKNTEQAARDFRRACFDKAVADGWADLVATAHHALDNAETVLLHLLRGCGLRGMSGIARKSGCVVRPLLSVTRDEIDAYAAEHAVPYVEDETNADATYSRNFLRHEILPLLERRFGGAIDALNRFAALAAEEDALLDALAPEPRLADGEVTVAIPKDTPRPLARRALAKALRMILPTDVESKHIDALLALTEARSGARVPLPHGVVATNDYGVVALCRPAPTKALPPLVWDGTTAPQGWTISPSPAAVPPPPALAFDADAVPTGAVWRHRKTGDVFLPFGGGTRPLKEFLIDKKIPARKRDGLVLLADGNRVLLIAGVEISRALAVTADTVRAVLLAPSAD